MERLDLRQLVETFQARRDFGKKRIGFAYNQKQFEVRQYTDFTDREMGDLVKFNVLDSRNRYFTLIAGHYRHLDDGDTYEAISLGDSQNEHRHGLGGLLRVTVGELVAQSNNLVWTTWQMGVDTNDAAIYKQLAVDARDPQSRFFQKIRVTKGANTRLGYENYIVQNAADTRVFLRGIR